MMMQRDLNGGSSNRTSNLAVAAMTSLSLTPSVCAANTIAAAKSETRFPYKLYEMLDFDGTTSCREIIKQERVSFATLMQLDRNGGTPNSTSNRAVATMDSLPPDPPVGVSSNAAPERSDTRFPYKLYQMLEFVEHEGLSEVVSWLPHHRAFKIHHRERFMSHVAHRFFKATKLRSIHYQLSVWGFTRVPRGDEADSWYHAHFRRGQPGELSKIFRTKLNRQCRPIVSNPHVPIVHRMPIVHVSPKPPALYAHVPPSEPGDDLAHAFSDVKGEGHRQATRRAPNTVLVAGTRDEAMVPGVLRLPDFVANTNAVPPIMHHVTRDAAAPVLQRSELSPIHGRLPPNNTDDFYLFMEQMMDDLIKLGGSV